MTLKDAALRVRYFLAGRSAGWFEVRKMHLASNPSCAACGGRKRLQVHHILPFHKFPARELDPTNLITLCTFRACHYRFGHAFDWKAYCPDVVAASAGELRRLAGVLK